MSADRYTRDVFISWDELHRDSRELCRLLVARPERFERIVAVTRGGLIPAAVVARELDVRLVDTICVVSYRGDQGREQDEAAEVLKAPEGDGSGCLLIDDLVDTGKTALKVREVMPKALFVAIYAKPEGRGCIDLCVREIPQTTWVRFPWDTELSFAVPLVERSAGAD